MARSMPAPWPKSIWVKHRSTSRPRATPRTGQNCWMPGILPNGTLRRWSGGRIESLPGFDRGGLVDSGRGIIAPHPFVRTGLRQTHSGSVCRTRGQDPWPCGPGRRGHSRRSGRSTAATAARELARCKLAAEVVEADGTKCKPGQLFDGVLIDAPCSSTGTIRRHPDVAWSKQPDDITALSGLQDRLLEAGLELLAPGGQLIFSTCSLQSAEGIERIERILERKPQLVRKPIKPDELFGLSELITPRATCAHCPIICVQGGLDGIFRSKVGPRQLDCPCPIRRGSKARPCLTKRAFQCVSRRRFWRPTSPVLDLKSPLSMRRGRMDFTWM